MDKMYYVYILANWDDSVLYIGVTSDLPKRLYEHRNHLVQGFPPNIIRVSWYITNIPTMCIARSLEKNN